ncbi:mannonate dehydratase [Sphingomonas sp. MA1305]|nr:mannonate dehydratase [Sphingomonas sp. MA1305]MBI0476372.1 mannonate dehydratase [Sphingomonas sp. MA1305]
MLMTQTMRWFGPADPVPLAAIRQAGTSEVVTALHDIPNGEVWPRAAIAARRAMVEAAGLRWTVVESLPVDDAIKTRGPAWEPRIDAYRQSLTNLAAEGIRVVTYNFMPLLDWTRTDLAYRLDDGALALRFDWDAVAAYDLHILRRQGAEADYGDRRRDAAARLFAALDQDGRRRLEATILAGLPGSEDSFTSDRFRAAIDGYAGIDADTFHAHHVAFLEAVCPHADALGIRLVVHPDDPPYPMFGLPRIVSTEADLDLLFTRVPNASNGLCFCTGSLGVRSDNDLPGMIDRLGSRIGFLHLRSVQREPDGAFYEAAHLEGDAGMPAIVAAVHRLSQAEGRSIPMRPDHGHQMLDDLGRACNPGYSLIGRMRGLAELRGLERGIAHASGAA